jgi:3-sulfinopropanoyl-CoA desulfinase
MISGSMADSAPTTIGLADLKAVVDRDIAPQASTWDEQEHVPPEHVALLASAGLLGMTLRADVGGSNTTSWGAAQAIAEVARGCGVSARIIVDSNFGAVQILDKFASDVIRQRYLPLIRRGEKLIAIAITEPEAGSAANELTTRAERTGDEIILTGKKRWITGAGERALYLVFARFDDIPGSAGVGAVLVEAETPGVRNGHREPTMGLRGLREAELHFDGCRVPAENVIVEPGGFGRLMAAYNGQRVGASAVAFGLAKGAMEVAIKYAKERHQFGRPIADYQAIQILLADMAIQLDAAELLIERAANSEDRYGFPDRYPTSVAKTFASEAAIFVTNSAIQVLGGNGYSRHYRVERMARDARMFTIGGGTTQMQRLAIAGKLLAD